MFGINFCDVKLKSTPADIISSFLKDTHIICSQSAEVTELKDRNSLKKTSCISSQRKIMKENSQMRKSFKKLQVQTRIFGINFCDVKLKSTPADIISSFLKDTHIICSQSAEVTELKDRNSLKKTSCISSQRKIMKENSQMRKSFKKLQVQTRDENYFS